MATSDKESEGTRELGLEEVEILPGSVTEPPPADEAMDVADDEVHSLPAPRPRTRPPSSGGFSLAPEVSSLRRPSPAPPPLPPSRPPSRPPARSTPPIPGAGARTGQSSAPPPAPAEAQRERAARIIESLTHELERQAGSPRAHALHHELGHRLEADLRDPERALAAYRAALALAPHHVPSLRGARRTARALGRWEEALEHLDAEARLTRDPAARAALYLQKGLLLADRVDDLPRAHAALVAARDLDRSNLAALSALVSVAEREGEWPTADDALGLLAAAFGDDPPAKAAALVRRATLHGVHLGDPPGALDLYDSAVALDPTEALTVGGRKELLVAAGRWKDLARALEEEAAALEAPAARAAALLRAAEVWLSRLGDRERATDLVAAALALDPRRQDGHALAVRLAEELGQTERAMEALAAWGDATSEPTFHAWLCVRIAALAEEGCQDRERALTWLRRAAELDPTNAQIQDRLVRLLGTLGRAGDLLTVLRSALEREPDAARKAALCVQMGDLVEYALGEPEAAAEHHERALAFAPDFGPALAALDRLLPALGRARALAELHQRAAEQATRLDAQVAHLCRAADILDDRVGDSATALGLFRAALEREPAHLGALRGYARAAARAGDFGAQADALEREATLSDVPSSAADLLCRAAEVTAERLHTLDRAVALLERALDLVPDHASAHEALCRHLATLGRWDALFAAHARALDALPHTPRARASRLVAMGELAEFRMAAEQESTDYYRDAHTAEPSYAAGTAHWMRRLAREGNWTGLRAVLEGELGRDLPADARTAAARARAVLMEEHFPADPDLAAAYADALAAAPYDPALTDAWFATLARAEAWADLAAALTAERTQEPAPLRVARLLRAAEVYERRLADPAQAIACLEAVIAIAPGHLVATHALGRLYRQGAQWEKVALLAATGARLATTRSARALALWELARAQESIASPQGDPGAALSALLALTPTDRAALDSVEALAISQGDPRAAAEVYERLAGLAEDAGHRAIYWTRHGEALEALADPRASSAFEAALTHDPQAIGAIQGLARLAERSGDPRLLAAAARREADVLSDGKAAADLLVRAAETQLKLLGDRPAAEEALARALSVDPTHGPAARRLADLARTGGDPTRAADVLCRAAAVATAPEDAATLWQEAAQVQADDLANVPSAIASLTRALRAHPTHVPSARALAALYARDGQWAEAVAWLERMPSLTKDPMLLRESHLGAARLWLHRLDSPPAAIAAIERALGLDPYHRDALGLLSEAHEATGAWAEASDAAERLLALAPQGKERAQVLLRIARLEEKQGDATRSRALKLEALALEGPGGEAALDLKTELTDAAEWSQYATALERHAEAALKGGSSILLTLLDLGRVLRAQLGDPARAADALLRGASIEPTTLSYDLELSDALLAAGRGAEALAVLEPHIARDPTDGAALRAFGRACVAVGEADRGQRVQEVLALVGGGAVPSAPGGVRAGMVRLAPGTLTGARVRTLLAERGLSPDVATVLNLMQPVVGKVYGTDFDGFGLTARDREETRTPSPLRQRLTSVTDMLGAPPMDLYVHRVRSRGVALEFGAQPLLFVPAAVLELDPAQQTFLLAKPALACAAGFGLIEKLTPRELEVLLAAATRLVDARFGDGLTSEDVLEETKKRLSKALDRKAKKAVQEGAVALRDLPPIDYAAWCAGAHQVTRELAALLSDDLAQAVELTRRLERDQPVRDTQELIERVPSARGIVTFWTSSTASALRRSAGPASMEDSAR